MKLAKIVCTIGPGSDKTSMIKKLSSAGMDIARLNLSHGELSYHKGVIDTIRKADNRLAVLLDTKGPEIRTDNLNEPIQLKKGKIFTLSTKKTDPKKLCVKQTYKNLPKDVAKGDIILIADGVIQLRVIGKSKNSVKCKVLSSAELGSQKSICVFNKKIGLPELTSKDIKDLKFGIKNDVDIIALSLIRKPDTVKRVKQMVKKAGKQITVIAKIEDPEAVENIDSILEVADGIMVARGDLGLSMEVERVPSIQKMLIKKANALGKPVIVATQMLETMVDSPKPTRAESSDVANAIYDGADAVMLSEETAIGKFPVITVKTMVKIINYAENSISHVSIHVREDKTIPESIAESVHDIVNTIDVKAIITPTMGGFTPNLIAKYRPKVPILATTHHPTILRKLAITRGVLQYFYKQKGHGFRLSHIKSCLRDAVKARILSIHDLVVIVYNHKLTEKIRTTNCLEIKVVGEILRPGHFSRTHVAKKHHG